MKNTAFLLSLLTITFFSSSCFDPQPEPPAQSAIDFTKSALLDYAKQQNPNAVFDFEVYEDEKRLTSIIKNRSVGRHLKLGKRDTTVVLGYITRQPKGSKSIAIHESRLIKKDSSLYAEVRNTQTNKVTELIEFPKLIDKIADGGNFGSLDDCVDEFFCLFEALKCEANRICEAQQYGIICCDDNGLCYSIHYYFPPTNPRCLYQVSIDLPLVSALN